MTGSVYFQTLHWLAVHLSTIPHFPEFVIKVHVNRLFPLVFKGSDARNGWNMDLCQILLWYSYVPNMIQPLTFQTFNLRIWWDFHFESCLKFGLRWPQWKLQWFCLYMISIYGPPCLHLLSYLNFSMSDMTIAEGKALHIIMSCNFNETVFISTRDYAIYRSHYLWCLRQIMHCTFSHHWQGSIDFNTVNTTYPAGMYFLIHPLVWINDERMAVHCLESGCIGLHIPPLGSVRIQYIPTRGSVRPFSHH